ncbi:MAG: hypothetical protein AAGD13_04675 [Pseudomonadota bacterium]
MKEIHKKDDLTEFQASERRDDDLMAMAEPNESAEHPAKPLTFMRLPAYVMTA